MKNSMKFLTALGLTLCLFFISSTESVAQKVVVAGNSGNIIQKNAAFEYSDEGLCTGVPEIYPESSSTVLIQGNGTVKITIQVDLTGSCLVPTSGGAIQREEPIIDENGNILAIGIMKITPSGMATYKVTF